MRPLRQTRRATATYSPTASGRSLSDEEHGRSRAIVRHGPEHVSERAVGEIERDELQVRTGLAEHAPLHGLRRRMVHLDGQNASIARSRGPSGWDDLSSPAHRTLEPGRTGLRLKGYPWRARGSTMAQMERGGLLEKVWTRFSRTEIVLTPERVRAARAIALVADLAQIAVFPAFSEGILSPLNDAVDAIVAIVLVRTIGWHWALLPTVVSELIPVWDIFPTWSAAVWFVTSGATTPPVPPVPPAAPPDRPRLGPPA
jgi:hypothetical protein